MKAIGAAVIACVFCLGVARAEEEAWVSSLKDAKVGDWVEYKMKAAAGAKHDMEMTQKRTVTAKDDKSITLKNEMTVMGHAMSREVVIPLDKPYNPGVSDPEAKVEKLEEGSEKLTINGKDYDTHWIKYKGTTKKGDAVEGKVWLAKGISMGGMVKMEGTAERGNVTMELVNFGSK
jgi:hypothetical protein